MTRWLEKARADPRLLLLGITVVGAVLRFSTLGVQSLWFDESFTILQLRQPLGQFLAGMDLYQATPPFYYLLAWPWERIFGEGAVGMRSLSAVLGTVTVPVVFLTGRTLFSNAAGLVAAALVATSPTLVWYSQEARPYACLVLLTSTALLFLARALRDGAGRDVTGFAVASALAIATHYFAAFLVVPAALFLLHRRRDRFALAALAAPLVAALAVLPLALAQRARGGGSYIADTSTISRAWEIARQFVAGLTLAPGPILGLLGAVLLTAGLVAVLVLTRGSERRNALLTLTLFACAVGIPLLLALGGENFLILRNLLSGWVPLALAAAGGFAATRARPYGLAAGTGLALVFAAITVAVAGTPSFQRSDWRGISRALDAQPASRAIIPVPGWSAAAINVYRPDSYAPGNETPMRVSELALVGPDAPTPAAAESVSNSISRLRLGRGSVRLGQTLQIRDLKLTVLVLDPPRSLTPKELDRAGLAKPAGAVLYDPR